MKKGEESADNMIKYPRKGRKGKKQKQFKISRKSKEQRNLNHFVSVIINETVLAKDKLHHSEPDFLKDWIYRKNVTCHFVLQKTEVIREITYQG